MIYTYTQEQSNGLGVFVLTHQFAEKDIRTRPGIFGPHTFESLQSEIAGYLADPEKDPTLFLFMEDNRTHLYQAVSAMVVAWAGSHFRTTEIHKGDL